MSLFTGTGVALVTPFKENGEIDSDSLRKLVEFQINNNIDYLVVLGTTAESATLNNQEKQLVIDTVVKANNGRLPLVLGIGSSNTASVISQIKEANLDSFSAILSVSPAYNKPTQEGIYQHFKAIATSTTKDIILYNVPGRTASNMTSQTTLRLANEFDNIIAIKEASGDLPQIYNILKDKPSGFKVISGDDMTALATTLAGGSGVISVVAQALPIEFTQMINYAIKGDNKAAYQIHYKLVQGIDLAFQEGNPSGIKAMLNKFIPSLNLDLRLPLVKVSSELKEKIISFVNQLK
ncbi:MAG: 4-hydroxy-tetrahydrodipicolinate synthase [Flavobacteriaceae bacterium]|nr:4-hydroxy-tetrahydrodipicolinate synthase [Flavobacteriaceae bacterium]